MRAVFNVNFCHLWMDWKMASMEEIWHCTVLKYNGFVTAQTWQVLPMETPYSKRTLIGPFSLPFCGPCLLCPHSICAWIQRPSYSGYDYWTWWPSLCQNWPPTPGLWMLPVTVTVMLNCSCWRMSFWCCIDVDYIYCILCILWMHGPMYIFWNQQIFIEPKLENVL